MISQVMGTEAIDVTEVFIRLQRRQVLYNAAILIFITVLLIFIVRGKPLYYYVVVVLIERVLLLYHVKLFWSAVRRLLYCVPAKCVPGIRHKRWICNIILISILYDQRQLAVKYIRSLIIIYYLVIYNQWYRENRLRQSPGDFVSCTAHLHIDS